MQMEYKDSWLKKKKHKKTTPFTEWCLSWQSKFKEIGGGVLKQGRDEGNKEENLELEWNPLDLMTCQSSL